MIEEHCRKGLSPAQIFKKMKGFVSLSNKHPLTPYSNKIHVDFTLK